ncbi:acyltransferase family protein [Corynebacterium sp. zg254]|uniref:Acyltransferase family protein n=1 Tax=Corynebacterium zhongnanshanii TaxID=2768834 RepID=A0ABQ6VEK8_9CORY|nr:MULTISPECIES: acyltransferase family protein [Corynebacterium]KAB3522866.1 acyltransferase family protein [Corynebacterium zhongnanshanii]MCR5914063.1 acyltransferase family protein [Corynebacterium sp. zg254]
MPKPIKSEQHYIPGLDGLRTLAVAAVILYHLHVPGVVGGLLGVGVFFTLSGFLITSNLMRAWDTRGNLGLKTFWLRRFRRLMPASVITIIVTVLLTAALARHKLSEWGMEGVSALFYVNNWHMIFKEKSYFDNFGGPSPLSHMWSLSVEEQFYLVWPLLLLLFLTVFRKRMIAMVLTFLVAVASFVWMWMLVEPGMDPTRIYEGTDTRAGGMLLGACLALWLSARKHKGQSVLPQRQVSTVMGAIGIAGIIALIALVEQESFFLYHGGLALLSVATVLAIFSVLHPDGFWNKFLGWEPLRWIGERSFGIYLWHMPVIAFLPQPWFDQNRVLGGVITVVVSVGLAALSWSIIEDPIRRNGIVGPIKEWARSRRAAREIGVSPAQATTVASRRFPSYFPAAATVILVALIAIALPHVIVAPDNSSQAAKMQTMEITDANRQAANGAGAGAGADSDGAGEATGEENKAAAQAAGRPVMSCTKVVHVGDSTSIGMFSADMVNGPDDTAFVQYRAYGAQDVVDSVFGARSTIEGWDAPDGSAKYPSAVESVTELVDQHSGPNTCWVIATGVNDAANIAAGATSSPDERIDAMMELLKDQDVMWATTRTNTNDGYYANSHMQEFNEALRRAQDRYPKLRLFDWAAEAQPDWYAPGDYAHYSTDGNSRRSYRFAAALAYAFPLDKDGAPSDDKIVRSGF